MASELENMEFCTDIYAQWSYSDHCSVLGVMHCAYLRGRVWMGAGRGDGDDDGDDLDTQGFQNSRISCLQDLRISGTQDFVISAFQDFGSSGLQVSQ